MIIKKALLTLICCFFAFGAQAQIKIGYTNVELVLQYMPETKAVNMTLQTYENKLKEQLDTKQKYARTRLEEYMDLKKKNAVSPSQDTVYQRELQKLDDEINNFVADAEQKIGTKREELLVPVLEKLQNSIETVAKESGYSYILNQTTSTGVSTILYGPEENDITEMLLKKLNITIPKAPGTGQ